MNNEPEPSKEEKRATQASAPEINPTASELQDKPEALEPEPTTGVLQPDVKSKKRSIRYMIVALFFLATFVGYASRAVLSVAIVGMLNNKSNPNFPTFDWDKQEKEGLVHSSFFWGYSVGQIPSGMFVQLIGSKWPLFMSIFISSLCVMATPFAAIYGGWLATCIVRVLQGITQASLFPALHSAIAVWTPLEERGLLATIILCGSQIGTIVTFPISGFLIPSPGGWPSVFYVFGGLGVLWSIFWGFLGSSTPAQHPLITKKELYRIENSIKNEYEKKMKIPWKEIFTSPPMWALIITHCSENFGFWTLMAEIPTYMDSVLDFPIQKNGVLSALPYLIMAILSFLFGMLADFFFKKNWLSVEGSRKVFNSIGFWIPAAALIGLGFLEKNQQSLAVAFLVIAVGFNAGNYAGFSLVHMDLSPNFSGIMMGITNCAANVFSTIGTLLADMLVREDKTSTQNWQIVFFVTAAMFFFGNLVFIIVGKTDRQPWNEPNYKRPNNKATPATNEKICEFLFYRFEIKPKFLNMCKGPDPAFLPLRANKVAAPPMIFMIRNIKNYYKKTVLKFLFKYKRK